VRTVLIPPGLLACAAAAVVGMIPAAAAAAGPVPVRPAPARLAAARAYALSRTGTVSFTVISSDGSRHALAGERTYVTASVVKAMLMTAYLNMHAIAKQPLTVQDRSELHAMITVSDNDAATWVYNRVGDARLEALARRLGMAHFTVSYSWGDAQLTTNDQARLWSQLGRAVYPPYLGYARSLLSSIVGWESWGIPVVARPLGWHVLFKGGWRPTERGYVVHQMALLERAGQTLVVCILSDGNPSYEYGHQTVEGITARLLGAGAGGKA